MTESLRILAVADPAIDSFSRYYDQIFEDLPFKVEIRKYPWAEYMPHFNKLNVERNPFDIVMAPGHLCVNELAKKGIAAPLENIFSKVFLQLYGDLSFAGKFYLCPLFYDGHVLLWEKHRSQLLDSFALTENGDNGVINPIALAKILSADFPHKFSLKACQSEIFTDALPYLRCSGLDLFNDQGKLNYLLPMLRPLEQYLKLKSLAADNCQNFGNVEVANSFILDQCKVITTWSGQLGFIDERRQLNLKDYGFATFDTAWQTTWGFATLSSSAHKEQCLELYLKLLTPKVDRLLSSVSGTPLLRDNLSKAYMAINEKLLENAKTLVKTDGLSDKISCCYTEIYRAFLGEISAEQALNDITKTIRDKEGL